MHETPDDFAALQDLLDRSYAAAGPHLRRIIIPQRRLSAEQVAECLTGMRLLALATVTADGRPLVGPVDGIFFRGSTCPATDRSGKSSSTPVWSTRASTPTGCSPSTYHPQRRQLTDGNLVGRCSSQGCHLDLSEVSDGVAAAPGGNHHHHGEGE